MKKLHLSKMASYNKYSHHDHMIPIMILLIAFSLIISSSYSQLNSSSCGISVYWIPRSEGDGSLREACATGNYKYVNVGFLNSFGNGTLRDGNDDVGESPVLNMGTYCDPQAGTCRYLSSEIQFCQDRGIQVLLSIGGPGGFYSLSYEFEVDEMDNYLWNTFLGGTDSRFSRPLGDVSLDGIDFAIQNPQNDNDVYWEGLARALSQHSTPQRKVYLSAAPRCRYPDSYLDYAIRTGIFDYVWVQFYDNPDCDYTSESNDLLDVWNEWNSSLPANSKLFLGLPASPSAGAGYIPPDELINNILPAIKSSSNYGGVMLWERYSDEEQGYSSSINATVCN